MQIIFGKIPEELKDKYTLLELDTVRINGLEPVTAWAVIETMNITDIPQIEHWRNLHSKLMENYRKKNWKFCEDAIEHLCKRWSGELNTFYTELSARIDKYKQQDPGPEWDGIYEKTISRI